MLPKRRLALQLTPLLDLLLIVMFSQYIENRHRTVAAQEALAAREKALDMRQAEADARIEQRRQALEKDVDDQKASLAELGRTYDEKFRSIINQHHQIGSILAESLNLPGNVMAEILKLRTSGSPDDAERLQEATERLQKLMQARGEEIFRFMLQVDEMQKHVTIWEIHVQANGQALITDSQQSFVTDFSSDADLVSRLFESSKSFSEPKTLIVVLADVERRAGRGPPPGHRRNAFVDGTTSQRRRTARDGMISQSLVIVLRVHCSIQRKHLRLKPLVTLSHRRMTNKVARLFLPGNHGENRRATLFVPAHREC